MKYIHDGAIKGKVSVGAIIRVVLGGLAFLYSILAFFLTEDIQTALLLNIIICYPACFLLLFFGLHSLLTSLKPTPRHNLAVMDLYNPNNPFYTTQCESCGLIFDYQRSDLGFRAWYPDGFVECPSCNRPHRHNAAKNIFRTEEITHH